MNTEIFHLGPLVVYSYGLWLALAFLTAAALTVREANRKGHSAAVIYELCVQLMVVAIVAGRIGYILPDASFYLTKPIELLRVAQGGLSYVAAFAAGMIYLYFFTVKNNIPMVDMLDMLAPGLAAGLIIGSMGALDNVNPLGALRIGSFYWPLPVIVFFTIEFIGLWYLMTQRRRLALGKRFWIVVAADALARGASTAWAWAAYGYALPYVISIIMAVILFAISWQQRRPQLAWGRISPSWYSVRRRRPVREQFAQIAVWGVVYLAFLVVLARSLPTAV